MSLMRRNVTTDIWRAVVVAGAMLGGSACVPDARGNEAAEVEELDDEAADEGDDGEEQATKKKKKKKKIVADAGPPADAGPDAAPRPRVQEKKEPRGRGFILG